MSRVMFALIALVVICLAAGCTGAEPGVLVAAHGAGDAGPPPPPPPPPPECTFTQGYWKTHPDAWPPGFTLELGGVVYSASELRTILRTPPRGDASMILAHQLIAAILNGGSADPSIADTVADALAWCDLYSDGLLPYGVSGGTAAHTEGTELAGDLADYNEGDTGPGHCGDVVTYPSPSKGI